MEAALMGAGQIGFTIISLTVSLIRSLIRCCSWRHRRAALREFAVTLAVTS